MASSTKGLLISKSSNFKVKYDNSLHKKRIKSMFTEALILCVLAIEEFLPLPLC